MFDLAGKVALVTGGARGIGLAECRLFVELGAKVVLADLRMEEGRSAASAIGEARCVFGPLDVKQPDQWRSTVSVAVSHFGKLDCLVNNAGIFRATPIETATVEDYMEVVGINQVGTFLGIQAVIPAMRDAGGGSIVNVASTAGVQASPGPIIAYTASKFAVRGMTRSAAIELGPLGIRVNTLIPGMIETPMNTESEAVMKAISALARLQPIPRLGQADECARLAAFLLSDAASYCTGSDFAADGGFLAGSLPNEGSMPS